MGGGACSPSSNVDMRQCDGGYEDILDGIDYFVVMAGCYFIYCLSYLCMFSIGC
jgi:hypothetical protein